LGIGVDSQTRNSGSQKASGIDVEANYRFDISDDGGAFGLSFVGSYLESLETSYGPGFDAFDCAGFYGLVCGIPTPEWKHRLRGTWTPPWDLSFSVSWRYVDGVKLDVNDSSSSVFGYPFNGELGDVTDDTIDSFDYFDASVDWAMSDNIRVIAGVKNILDQDPPAVDSQSWGISSPPFGNANTYPVVYDAFGREVFVSMTTRF
jgi:outer membrane receptor protein involved in Fe transport